MIKHKKQNNINSSYNKEEPSLYNITFSNSAFTGTKASKDAFKEILLSHFHLDEERVEEMHKNLSVRQHLSIGKYTKDVAETKIMEVNKKSSLQGEDFNVIMTINNL